ncbi:MAG: HD domain-containing protein [Alphaproteobacteria bacterium]|jgi:phosphonate degradation associated HDIG domain protein|nr:HD domain-containing protein [Alphaproteobacteria bacterium]
MIDTPTPSAADRGNPDSVLDAIFAMFRDRGAELYGERVTQRQHALQTAMAAERGAASASLVAAALLHDIGHMVSDRQDGSPDDDTDDRHEDIGAAWLAPYFPPAVTEPIRLHVAAKRYLCAVEPDYARDLSPTSVHSLRLQGGPMSPGEAEAFEADPYHADAVRLRRFDEAAKVRGLETPPLEAYADLLRAAMH